MTMQPTIKTNLACTYHRDGSVSFWNIFTQQWDRRPAKAIPDKVLASLNDAERRRVAAMAAA